jgi:murein DD-endopeptidase MepM/ murein hydrolase activator NlpD
MANLPLAFAELLLGAIVVDAGIKGDTITNVVKGQATTHPLSTGGSSSSSGGPGGGSGSPGTGGVLQSLFQAGAKLNIGRHDQGLDVEGPPNTDVYAPGNGTVVQNNSDPSGFGNSYPIIHWTSGPWAGLTTYFGHVQSLVQQGAQVTAGEAVAVLQNGTGPYVGNAAGIPGHIEIGLWGPSGPGPFGGPLPPGLG